MNDYLAKDNMVKEMINDLGLQELAYTYGHQIPVWLYIVCDTLIRAGWRKHGQNRR